jgi:dipeptidyl aminopeptidase/acylaminoacyl peptidase
LISNASDVDPESVYLFDRNSGEVKLLYKSRPTLTSEYLSEMKPVKYTARDGIKIPAYVVVPNGTDGKNLPTVIFPHGGPWARTEDRLLLIKCETKLPAQMGGGVLITEYTGSN